MKKQVFYLLCTLLMSSAFMAKAQVKILPNGNVGIGTLTPSYKLHVNGDIYADNNWLRTSGATGWYNVTHGGGWYMTDAIWIRSVGNKSIYHNSGLLRTDGTLQVGNNGSTLNIPSAGNFSYRTNVLFANTSGRVGVGTNNPGAKLDILTTTGVTGLRITIPSTNATGFYLNGTAVTGGYNFGMTVDMYSLTSKAITIQQNGSAKVWITPRGININQWDETYNLSVSGTAYCSSEWSGSDVSYKTNILPIENATYIVENLRGVSFDYNNSAFPQIDFGKTSSFGVIAQELETVLPNLVKTDLQGYKAVNYNGLIPFLIEAIKEQQKEINDLKVQFEECCKQNSVTPAGNE